ncbi:hypothetical protein [Methanotorris igneus]|uniref:Uncharacterized protein n=1 Tax=Methanotorris igneus (strain DSM 5666 / JCM 11834 / Kol 5) TaxID=880724 RepID=F6BAD9_METIK|nr:hypothetical protein [Methanotorris igneus]AEF95829.1 hypothetical protein Metig_0273 [Methanotorris igneus Kol 5]
MELGVISERSDENLKTVRFLCPRQGQRHSCVADDAQVQYGYLLTNTHIGQTPKIGEYLLKIKHHIEYLGCREVEYSRVH